MRRAVCTGIVAVSAILLIVMGILVTMFFSQIADHFIYKKLELKEGGERFEIWRKPPLEPQMKVYFFNVTNPREFLQGEKPVFRQIGPYVYSEVWEKVNLSWHANGTVTYQPTKKYFFNRNASSGDEMDLVQTLNVPLISAADRTKHAVRLVRMVMSTMLNVLNQETFTVRTVKELLWGYEDSLVKTIKDKMPPTENFFPHDKVGFFVGKNGTSADGVFTVFTGRDSMTNYAHIDNWNGKKSLSHWKTEQCNRIEGTDGTAFPPDLTPDTTLHLYNPDLCRSIPLVFHKQVAHHDLLGYRFGPPNNLFDTAEQNPANECYCPSGNGASCGIQGLFNISACKFGLPMSISWPHFLHGDPKLLSAVEGLNPDPAKHSFYIDYQPKLSVAMSVKVRVQINLMLSKVDDVKQVAGIPEMAFPLFWFESGVELTGGLIDKLKIVSELPEKVGAGISYSMFGLGGILLLCLALMIWKRKKSQSYGIDTQADVEFEKRMDEVTVKSGEGHSNDIGPINNNRGTKIHDST